MVWAEREDTDTTRSKTLYVLSVYLNLVLIAAATSHNTNSIHPTVPLYWCTRLHPVDLPLSLIFPLLMFVAPQSTDLQRQLSRLRLDFDLRTVQLSVLQPRSSRASARRPLAQGPSTFRHSFIVLTFYSTTTTTNIIVGFIEYDTESAINGDGSSSTRSCSRFDTGSIFGFWVRSRR